MNEITIGDKTYISAKRAAEITGYARDYVGQLCREGHVDAKMVGRSWYVFEPSIRAHRFGGDATPPAPNAPEASADTDAASDEPLPNASEAPKESVSGWREPKYTPEMPEMLPEVTAPRLEELLPPPEETLTDMQAAWREWFDQKQKTLETPELEAPEAIEERNEAEADDQEVEIPLHRVEDEPELPEDEPERAPEEAEERIAIHHIASQAPVPAPVHPSAYMDIRRAEAPMPEAMPAPVQMRAEPVAATPAYAPSYAEHGRIVSERVIMKPSKGKRGKNRAAKQVRARRGSNAPIIAVLIGISVLAIAVAAIGTGYASRYFKTLPTKNNPAINFLVGTREYIRQ